MDSGQLAARWFYKRYYGFRTIPPPDGQAAHGRALLCCANGDGTLSEAERDWVLGYSAAKGYDASLVEELKHYPANEDIVALVTSHPALNSNRLCLVHDALCACLADGELTDGEWKTVLRMAAKLDVAEDQVIAIRDAIAAETNAREARIKLIYPNQIPF
ncbi:hypothetical protein [Sorangium atrum]|uniref:Co-chaperone DjlA N-terminal domain-containing protein n=1 Tax=Sorangium atrum TaxID=2995308 RepID=A0ABT5BZI9_9BACT|nr:hypothetical protein [Sorangium aterium]MDC0679577.1 hypothetical protein [Sorangium aterium]